MRDDNLNTSDLIYMQSEVVKWNALFGNDVIDLSLVETYKKLTLEELSGSQELIASFVKNDVEGILDGIIDVAYTGLFWCALQDVHIDMNDPWFSSNNWQDRYGYSEESQLEEVLNSLKEEDVLKFQTDFIMFMWSVSHLLDIIGAFNRITESNYSKALSKDNTEYTLQECLDSVKSIGRYEDVFVEETSTHYIIKARVDTQEGVEYPSGKVVKGIWYKSVESLGGLKEFIK